MVNSISISQNNEGIGAFFLIFLYSRILISKGELLMNVFNLFKPANHAQKIEDQETIKKEYRYWRLRIFYTMFAGYVFYYFTRKSFTFAMPGMIENLGFDKAKLGFLSSTLYISYGVSKFASGVMSDQANPRYFMAMGLIITGITNIFFGMSSSLLFFAIFCGINGWFQGWGWPPCARLLTHWYSQKERGKWWSVWSTSHNVGGFLIPILIAFCLRYFGWRYAMVLPGVLCIAMGFILMNRLRDTPQSLGLPPIEEFKGEKIKVSAEEEKELSTKQILFDYVLKNKWMWFLALSSFFVYIIRIAINDWSALYLIETKHYSYNQANGCVALFEIGGLFGMLVAGWLTDKIGSGQRGPINVIFAIGMVFSILLFSHFKAVHVIWDSVLLFTFGFFLFGPQMLMGLAAAELAHKKAAGTASGFAGWFGYVGAATAGYPLGIVIEHFGWSTYYKVLLICGWFSVAFLLPLWKAKPESQMATAS